MSENKGLKLPTKFGLLVGVGIGLGALLSAILPEFNFGLGTGWNGVGNGAAQGKGDSRDESTTSENTDTSKAMTKPVAQSTPVEPPAPTEVATEGPGGGTEAAAPELIYVIISGRDYFLRADPEDRVHQQRASLSQVIEAAKQTTGDENGVRVRVWQLTTAKTTAFRALMQELGNADIPRSAIRTKEQPVEE